MESQFPMSDVILGRPEMEFTVYIYIQNGYLDILVDLQVGCRTPEFLRNVVGNRVDMDGHCDAGLGQQLHLASLPWLPPVFSYSFRFGFLVSIQHFARLEDFWCCGRKISKFHFSMWSPAFFFWLTSCLILTWCSLRSKRYPTHTSAFYLHL